MVGGLGLSYMVTSVCMSGTFVTAGTGDVSKFEPEGCVVTVDGSIGVSATDFDDDICDCSSKKCDE